MNKTFLASFLLLVVAGVAGVTGCSGAPVADDAAREDPAPDPALSDVPEEGDAGAAPSSRDAAPDAAPRDGASEAGEASVDAGPPTWTNVYAKVLMYTCTGCHGGSYPSAGLDLSTQYGAYAALVGGAPSNTGLCNLSGLKRVEPGARTKSILWAKVDHNPVPCGNPMPYGSKYYRIAQWRIDLLGAWIDNGAKND